MKILWIFVGITVILGIALFFRSRYRPSVPVTKERGKGIPEGREGEYNAGLSPLQCDRPVLYTLHTCRHCTRLKEYLEKRHVFVQEVYLDDFADPARKSLLAVLRSYNPRISFPTLVLPDGRYVVGFQEKAVQQLFGWDNQSSL